MLFINGDKTFRVDADRKGVLMSDVETIEYGCKSTAGLAKAFVKIAENTDPLGGKVWLLFLTLPSLLISLPSMQVQGVDEAMLTQALQFEAEGMTGVSSQEMRVAFQFLKAEDEMSDYWLVQIEQLAWDDLLKALKQRKCQLGGLLHPGALPVSIHDAEAPEWLRIEAWSNQVLALHRSETRLSMQALSFDNPHWQAELDQWLQDQGESPVSETLLNYRVEVLPDTEHRYDLFDGSQLAQWLGLWAQTLIGRKAAEAAVLKLTANFNVDLAWMAGSGLAALLLCGLHAGWFMHQRVYFEGETERLTKVEKAMADLRKQISASSDQKQKLETSINKISADAELIPNTIKKLQQRPALLLRALADGRHEQLIIETLDSRLDEVVVGGITLQQHLGNELAGYLNGGLQDLNWRVESPTKENMALFEGEAGPWSFKLKLVDEGIPGFAVAEKK